LDRNVKSAYLTVESELTEKLTVNASARVEDHSDFGGVTTGGLSGRYEINSAFAWRGSASTGFRSPSVGQSAYSYAQTTTLPNREGWFKIRTLPAADPAAIALGSAPLKPEKSVNYSTGVVWEPVRNSAVTLDVYQISIRERIALSENFTGVIVEDILEAAGYPQSGGANFFTNALDTRTRGLSLTGKYRLSLGSYGSLDLSLGFEKNQTRVTKNREVNGRTPVGRQAQGLLEYGTPDTKLVLTGVHTVGDWSIGVTAIRYGEYRQLDNRNPELDQTFSPQVVTNLNVTYRVTPDSRFRFGANNIFNTHPDNIRTYDAQGGNPNSSLNPEGYNGTFVYLGLDVDF
jgi:iron complex outermembrane receptor protein